MVRLVDASFMEVDIRDIASTERPYAYIGKFGIQ